MGSGEADRLTATYAVDEALAPPAETDYRRAYHDGSSALPTRSYEAKALTLTSGLKASSPAVWCKHPAWHRDRASQAAGIARPEHLVHRSWELVPPGSRTMLAV